MDSTPVTLTDGQCGYIAGILDGEGWLGITIRKRGWKRSAVPHYHRPACVVGQAKAPILDWLISVLGTKDLVVERRTKFKMLRLHPPCLRWLLPQLMPWLVLKRRQAEILLEFMSDCRYQGKELTHDQWAKREQLRVEIMKLNEKPNGRFS